MNNNISKGSNIKNIKIGILTFHFSDNFGASLQLFAHYSFLKQSGYNVEVINYLPKRMLDIVNQSYNLQGFNIKSIFKNVLSRKYNSVHLKKHRCFLRANFDFSKPVYTHEELIELSEKYDLIVVGSDQVWNPLITQEYFESYLMKDFKCKKMSYAASFGKEIDEKYIPIVVSELESYDDISVREKGNCDQINQHLISKKASTVMDPVFLISKDNWSQFALKCGRIKNDYIVIYMLDNNEDMLETAHLYAKEKGFDIYTIETRNFRLYKRKYKFKRLHDLSPQEFVWIIKNSKAVFTNSFHATAFSLIFNKIYFSFSHSSLNLRISNILSLYNMSNLQLDRSVDNVDILDRIADEEISQYNRVNDDINNAIKKSKDFLLKGVIGNE